jgi:hypothetical protein
MRGLRTRSPRSRAASASHRGRMRALASLTAALAAAVPLRAAAQPTPPPACDLANRPDDETFAGNTTAIEVGAEPWLGSYLGDRIAIVPAR